MKYNDVITITRNHTIGKEIWNYVSFIGGLKLQQFLTAEKAANALAGLRATVWKETYRRHGNTEMWTFRP